MAKPKAIGYVRVSTAEQVNGFGLDVQEQAIRHYAKEHGLRLIEVARDEGFSGATGVDASNGLETRPGLAGALSRIEGGDADALIVYRYDRLARDLVLQETVIRRLGALTKSGGPGVKAPRPVPVLSVTEPEVDAEDHTRVLVRQVLGAISQYERVVIRSRMAAGKAAKKAKGGYVGGRPPYGWRAERGELVHDAEEQETISFIVAERAAGASYRALCGSLAARGALPRGGGDWFPIQVQRVAERHARRQAG